MRRPPISRRHVGLAALGLFLLVGFGLVVARSGPLAPVRVTVARVETSSVTPSLFGIGLVEARRAYFIGPTAAGRVRTVAVDVGDRVTAGQLLAEMDPVDLDDRLLSLDAARARAHSAVAAAEAQQRDAAARRELAALNDRRYRELGDRRFVSPSAVEGRRQELTSAAAALDGAEANLRGSREELRRLAADRAGLARQRQTLRLLAPAAGIVTSRDAEPGSTVVAGQAVVRLVEPDSLWFRVRIDQGRSRGLAEGLPADVVLRSHPGLRLAGRVVRVEPVSDGITEERIAFVALDRPFPELSIGELAEVTLRGTASAALPTLDNAAVKHTAQGAGVWALRNGRPEFVPVVPGEAGLDGRVQIVEGLHAGDEVIVFSEKALSAGARIAIVDRLAGGRP